MDNQTLYECISHVYMTFGIDTFPIDCLELVRKCGFRLVRYSDLNRKRKTDCQTLSEDACLLDGTLFYEAQAHPRHIQFAIAHEFGHVFLKTDSEDEADAFASHFLAPRILIHKYGYRNSGQLHDAFGLSFAASNRALLSYKEWFRNISYSAAGKPTESELRLEHIFFPESELAPITAGTAKPSGTYDSEGHDTELNQCSDFMNFLGKWRGDFGFGIAESKWLYGNDL